DPVVTRHVRRAKGDERPRKCGHRAVELWMFQCDSHRGVPSHRDPGDSAAAGAPVDTIPKLDFPSQVRRNELLVSPAAVVRIRKPGARTGGRNHQELRQLSVSHSPKKLPRDAMRGEGEAIAVEIVE